MSRLKLTNFDYNLPADKIAKFPLKKRDDAKLLFYKDGQIRDYIFSDLPKLTEGDLLVLNNTKVLPVRILVDNLAGKKTEFFCLEPLGSSISESLSRSGSQAWWCLVGGAKNWKDGQDLFIKVDNKVVLITILEKSDDGRFVVEFALGDELTMGDLFHKLGDIPLPPYLKRESSTEDFSRYQTVFARELGAVASPTASLHFTPEVLSKIDFVETTLHVGLGTFLPVKVDDLSLHHMHTEKFNISIDTIKVLFEALSKGRRIVAVGTTVVRLLESLPFCLKSLEEGVLTPRVEQWSWQKQQSLSPLDSLKQIIFLMNKYSLKSLIGETAVMIVPGFDFKVISGMVTNFHQPKSTLISLVSAFIGEDWRLVYDYALSNKYRFLSYGDSSYLIKSKR